MTVITSTNMDSNKSLAEVTFETAQAYEKTVQLIAEQVQETQTKIEDANLRLQFIIGLAKVFKGPEDDEKKTEYCRRFVGDNDPRVRLIAAIAFGWDVATMEAEMQKATGDITSANANMQKHTLSLQTALNNKEAYVQLTAAINKSESDTKKGVINSI